MILWAGWPVPPIFRWLATNGPVAPEEMLRTFNMGIGMTAVVAPEHIQTTIDILNQNGIAAQPIGEVVQPRPGDKRVVVEGEV